MTEENIAELETAVTAAATAAEEAGGDDEELNTARDTAQKALDDAKAEAAKAPPQSQEKTRTETQKLRNALIGISNRAKELGIDPLEILNKRPKTSDDDKPLTMSDLKRLEADKAKENASKLVDSIEDNELKEQVKHHLENTIRLSGDPEKDFKNALSLADSEKKSQVIEELNRRSTARTHSSSSGAPSKGKKAFEPTPEEAQMMAGFGLSEEDVLKAREKSQK